MRVSRLLVCVVCIAAACPGSELSEKLYKSGQWAERSGDTLQAYLFYARAAALDPANRAYALHKNALQNVAMTAQTQLGADPAPAATAEEPPGSMTGNEILESRAALPPPTLDASKEKKTFDIKGDVRTIFEQVTKEYGLLVAFEQDYQAPPNFTFRINDASYTEALHALEMVSNSFLVPLSPKLVLVVRDTPQKRAERAPVMAVELPIPERLSVQEAQEIVTAVQQTLDIRRIAVDPGRHMVYIRDQVSKVEVARAMFANLARGRTQIEVEFQFISVEKTSSLNFGIEPQTSFPLVDFGHFLNNTPYVPTGYTNFLSFGGGSTMVGIGITTASLFATVSKSTTTNLLEAQVVSLDGQAASLHVGNRYPIITNGYYGTSTGTGTVYTPPPTVNYQDLGLVLKVTPSVHSGEEVTLDLETEFNVLGPASSISGIPVVSSRKYNGKVRLKFDEWAVMAGLVQLTDSDQISGLAGAINVPIFGRLFGQTQREHDTGEVLIVIKPRLLNLPPWEFTSDPIWVGTETHPLTVF